MKNKKAITERFFIRIICKYKNDIKLKGEVENEINKILEDYTKKTGREVQAITIQKQKDNYNLLLEIK